MITGALSIAFVLAWCLAPAVFDRQLTNFALALSLKVMYADNIARETLGLNR